MKGADMAKKREGWEIGQGKVTKDVEIHEYRGPDPNGGKGKEIAKLVYDDSNPKVAQRG